MMTDMMRVKTGATQDEITLAEGRARDEDARLEVIDGQLITEKRIVPWQQTFMMRWLFLLMHEHVFQNDLGTVYPDGARYILRGADPSIEEARIPPLSFLRKGRVPADFDPLKDFEGAPDQAVEVLSPGQVNATLLKKIAEYLAAGSEEAWYILPRRSVLQRFRNDMDGFENYAPGDTLETPVLPGFKLSLTELFDARRAP
jgi:Uma2 family endonuclease